MTQRTEHQDLSTCVGAVRRAIARLRAEEPPLVAPSLARALDELGDAMTPLLPPEQITEVRRRRAAARAGTVCSECA